MVLDLLAGVLLDVMMAVPVVLLLSAVALLGVGELEWPASSKIHAKLYDLVVCERLIGTGGGNSAGVWSPSSGFVAATC